METPTPGSEKPVGNSSVEAQQMIKEIAEDSTETKQDKITKVREAINEEEPKEEAAVLDKETPEEAPVVEEKEDFGAKIKKFFGLG